jgi:hypothetical protein
MFWEAASSDAWPLGYESTLLAPGATRTLDYALPAPASRITARLLIQAIGLDVIDDFAGMALPITERVLADVYMQSGNLRSPIRTLTIPGTQRELSLRDGRSLSTDDATPDPSCASQDYASQLGPIAQAQQSFPNLVTISAGVTKT